RVKLVKVSNRSPGAADSAFRVEAQPVASRTPRIPARASPGAVHIRFRLPILTPLCDPEPGFPAQIINSYNGLPPKIGPDCGRSRAFSTARPAPGARTANLP